MEEEQATIGSIDNCISALQGDLNQPGTPAIILRLTASWQKLKSSRLLSGNQGNPAGGSEDKERLEETDSSSYHSSCDGSRSLTDETETKTAATPTPAADINGQELTLESSPIQSSGLLT